ncbi:MAG: glycosyltransferase [Emcibacter sp.]|nr:glycosyltransferase [Emcibacter sp.]
MKKIINVAEVADQKWNFIEDFYPDKDVCWKYYSANSKNWLERIVKRPKISRYMACMKASMQLRKKGGIVISHMPRTTHWQSKFMNMLNVKSRHLAFSFNFTELPNRRTRASMSDSFKRVECFVVYSEFERKLYSDYFRVPIEKIKMLHWAMETPQVDENFIPVKGSYYCSIGGEGRDYKTLLLAFEKLKDIKLVIVTRPHTIEGLSIPKNVKVFYNIPHSKFWAVVKNSKAVLVPLINENTACGHITLVGSMKLGKAIITTKSKGTEDYIFPNDNALVTPPGEVDPMVDAVKLLEKNGSLCKTLGDNALVFSNQYCDLSNWVKFIKSFIET